MLDEKLVASEMSFRLKLLAMLFAKFEQSYGYTLRVKDFSGFMVTNPQMEEFIQSYLFHDNSFCGFVKNRSDVYKQCVFRSNKLLMRKITKVIGQRSADSSDMYSGDTDRGFFGVCWCGVQEYVFPICHSGIVIGALLVGPFRSESAYTERAFRHLNKRYGLSVDQLRDRYDAVALDAPPPSIGFKTEVAMLASYLSMLAEYYIEFSLVSSFEQAYCGNYKQPTLVSHAIEYITSHYTQKITVKDIANACYCSESTINHLFSSITKRTVPEYVALQRVNRAKHLLLHTNLSMEQIAPKCGFSSSAYFCTVFKSLTGIPPKQYREHLGENNRKNAHPPHPQ